MNYMPPVKDTIGRRLRFKATSTGRKIYLEERDYEWFAFLHRHGDLPGDYLHALTKDLCVSEIGAKKRMGRLFHESKTRHYGRYLERPPQQRKTDLANFNKCVYSLTPASISALQDREMWHENAPQVQEGMWEHDFMASCYTASVELAVRQRPDEFAFIPQHEILDRIGVPLKFHVPFTYEGELYDIDLEPDRIFGIRYLKTDTARLFLVEIDHGTENQEGVSKRRKSSERNQLQYREFIGKGGYKTYFPPATQMMVIYQTINAKRMQNMISIADKISDGKGNNYSLYGFIPQFHRDYFEVPPVLWDKFTQPYQRSGHPPFPIYSPDRN